MAYGPPEGYPADQAATVDSWDQEYKDAYWYWLGQGNQANAEAVAKLAMGGGGGGGRGGGGSSFQNVGRWQVADIPSDMSKNMWEWRPRQIAQYFNWGPDDMQRARGTRLVASAWEPMMQEGWSMKTDPDAWRRYKKGWNMINQPGPSPEKWREY